MILNNYVDKEELKKYIFDTVDQINKDIRNVESDCAVTIQKLISQREALKKLGLKFQAF